MMFVPKWYWESFSRLQHELERRVKRLELMALEDAESKRSDAERKIASLQDKKAGAMVQDGLDTIEEIIDKR